MANTKVTGDLIADATITATNIADGSVTAAKLTGITTTSIAEGDKLFYTDARVGTYLSSNGYDTAANIIATITDSAPATLDTLNELAAALGDDPNYATTTATLIGTKLPLAGGTLTGPLTIGYNDGTSPYESGLIVYNSNANNSTGKITIGGSSGSGEYYFGEIGYDGDNLIFYNERNFGGQLATIPRMIVDPNGNIIIGQSSSVGVANSIAHYTNNFMYIRGGTAGLAVGDDGMSTSMYMYDNSILTFNTAGSEAMRIDASGRVGIGESNPLHKISFSNTISRVSGIDYSFTSPNLYTDIISSGTSGGWKGNIRFFTSDNSASTERMRITSSGNVGIGTTTPISDAKLHLANAGAEGLEFAVNITTNTNRILSYNRNTSVYNILRLDGSDIDFYTNGGGFRMRVDSAGYVGIGSAAPASKLHVQDGDIRLQSSGGNPSIYFGSYGISTDYPQGRIVLADDGLYGGNIDFYTKANGAPTNGLNFAMRIKSDGNVGIGTTTPSEKIEANGTIASITSSYPTIKVQGSDVNYQGRMRWDTNNNYLEFLTRFAGTYYSPLVLDKNRVRVNCDENPLPSNGDGPLAIVANSGEDGINIKSLHTGHTINIWKALSTASNAIVFYHGDTQGATVGIISTTTSGTTYSTTSDYRAKQNIVKLENALNRVSKLKPSRFNFITDTEKVVDGFIAHEVENIVPEAIVGEKDAIDEKGNPIYQSIDQSKLVPLLTAAIQELKDIIDSQQQQINELKEQLND